jgi:hypothetical protein
MVTRWRSLSWLVVVESSTPPVPVPELPELLVSVSGWKARLGWAAAVCEDVGVLVVEVVVVVIVVVAVDIDEWANCGVDGIVIIEDDEDDEKPMKTVVNEV